ncbi:MAG: DUF1206 domain-containing protein [Actinomycetota bacterium]|nr:DUF1206 domain-containing protein [Actinomycetota bacterium]
MTQLAASARRASNSQTMSRLARFGLAARGFVYLVIGWLAIQIALGDNTPQANQRGALAEVARNSAGLVLLWVLGAGFAAYALWRLSEAAFGTAVDGKKTGPRLQSLFRGLAYVFLAVTTFTFIAGTSRRPQAQQQASETARLMRHSYGRWLVGLVGLIVVVVGVVMIYQGVRTKFTDELHTQQMRRPWRTIVVRLGMIGTVARGLVFALAGVLTVVAAVTFDAAKSTGLDGALRTLARQPLGPWLLGIVGAGLIAFGLYGFAAARYSKT